MSGRRRDNDRGPEDLQARLWLQVWIGAGELGQNISYMAGWYSVAVSDDAGAAIVGQQDLRFPFCRHFLCSKDNDFCFAAVGPVIGIRDGFELLCDPVHFGEIGPLQLSQRCPRAQERADSPRGGALPLEVLVGGRTGPGSGWRVSAAPVQPVP